MRRTKALPFWTLGHGSKVSHINFDELIVSHLAWPCEVPVHEAAELNEAREEGTGNDKIDDCCK